MRGQGGLSSLVGLAVRRNPKRAHLLVSAVLGKHVPTDPRLVYGSGLLLGELVRARLRGEEPSRPGPLLPGALRGEAGAARGLRDLMREPRIPVEAIVLGYAETATALGHSVADALGGAYYLHSTRRPVEGFATYGGSRRSTATPPAICCFPPTDRRSTAMCRWCWWTTSSPPDARC